MTESMPTLSTEQGSTLVLLARRTLLEHFGGKLPPDQAARLESGLRDKELQRLRGVFVTLKKKQRLRGCIGSLIGRKPVIEGVRAHVLDSALRDPRFDAVSQAELKDIVIEISILTQPRALVYEDAGDLLAKLRPHVDGVTIRDGCHQATFLPQVWDQLPRPEDFLTHLCSKAGLPGKVWQTGRLEVETYQVQHFEEE